MMDLVLFIFFSNFLFILFLVFILLFFILDLGERCNVTVTQVTRSCDTKKDIKDFGIDNII